MAPEMEKGYNASVDLWSLGLITYELLTNTLPFTGKTEKETIENIKVSFKPSMLDKSIGNIIIPLSIYIYFLF